MEDGQRFCGGCGAAQQPTAQQGGQYSPPVQPQDQTPFTYERDVHENKAFAIISYISFLSIVSYFAAPKSPYARFHAVQGLNLFIMEAIISVAGGLLRALFGWWFLGSIISAIVGLCGVGFLVLSIIGIVNASQGKMEELPVVGPIKFVKH